MVVKTETQTITELAHEIENFHAYLDSLAPNELLAVADIVEEKGFSAFGDYLRSLCF